MTPAVAEHIRSPDGTPIAFERTGDGPPVVFVGGAFQYRAIDATTAELAHLMADRFTVYSYDRRGRGDSGDAHSYSVDREIDDLEAIVADAGGSACVFGNSSGAALALEAAARGVEIDRLALFEPPFAVGDTRPLRRAGFCARLGAVIAAGGRGPAVELFLTEAAGVPRECVAEMRRMPVWPALEAVAHTLVYDTAIMSDPSLLSDRTPAIAVPSLVMDGDRSPAWAREAVRVVADLLPNGRRHTLHGQTHDVAPQRIAPVMTDFFSEQ